jgi:hypothetical protein
MRRKKSRQNMSLDGVRVQQFSNVPNEKEAHSQGFTPVMRTRVKKEKRDAAGS